MEYNPLGLVDDQGLASIAFLNELHNFLECMVDSDCPQDQAVGDSEETILTANVPSLTTEILDELPNLSQYAAEGSCPKE
ncbi:hypothetical protein AV530_014609 [Patagioenas fasciata monilis]|uniref:Uncharacterized protein n=1 Tax=Patagioenas fasciata monilis TaxID=372326 RepID=A0A1V4J5W8_PATFA|nr:hypothetical protein AV530_014609 [Patagioenas fasciata monilis]